MKVAVERARRWDEETQLLIVPQWFLADPKLNTVYILWDGTTFTNLEERMA